MGEEDKKTVLLLSFTATNLVCRATVKLRLVRDSDSLFPYRREREKRAGRSEEERVACEDMYSYVGGTHTYITLLLFVRGNTIHPEQIDDCKIRPHQPVLFGIRRAYGESLSILDPTGYQSQRFPQSRRACQHVGVGIVHNRPPPPPPPPPF